PPGRRAGAPPGRAGGRGGETAGPALATHRPVRRRGPSRAGAAQAEEGKQLCRPRCGAPREGREAGIAWPQKTRNGGKCFPAGASARGVRAGWWWGGLPKDSERRGGGGGGGGGAVERRREPQGTR